jgi:hypothetical protein
LLEENGVKRAKRALRVVLLLTMGTAASLLGTAIVRDWSTLGIVALGALLGIIGCMIMCLMVLLVRD